MTQEEQTIWLAALLHDVGKFYERKFEPLPTWAEIYQSEAKYSHEPFSAAFVEEFADGWTESKHTLRQVVLKHHCPALHDEWLVSVADRLSANERAEAKGDTEGARGRAESTLRAILSCVELNEQKADKALYHQLEALSLDPDTLLPREDARGSADAYRYLWREFISELQRAPRRDFTTLLALLRKFAWAIPSDTHRDTIPDISLYHHLKTTAAIALCLVKDQKRRRLSESDLLTLDTALTRLFKKESLSASEKEAVDRPYCALVKGDISGTQDFLYLLTSSGAARGLRGRSFYLQLLTEVIAHWILRQSNLPATNLLFAGGGHFYLLLPYTQTKESIDGWRRTIADKLWRAHKGDLSLTVDCVPVAARDFLEGEQGGNAFADKWGEVSRKVNERKQRKWRDLDDKTMMRELFTAHQRGTTAEEMCQVCHGEWKQGVDRMDYDTRKCRRCHQFERLGQLLRDPTHLVVFTVPESEPPDPWDWRGVLRAFGVLPWLVHEGEGVPDAPSGSTAATVYTFDSTDFLNDDTLNRFRWGDLPVSYDFRLLADATPLKRNEQDTPVIADFSDLAEASQGVKWLGVLRMDVDSLGDVFKEGLGKQATISRMSTLSESLRLFFEGYVPQLCQRYNPVAQASSLPDSPQGAGATRGDKDALYLIYAGGDDLFVVGAWSVLPELAKQIRDDFRRFVGGDHVTLSGGIAIEHQKYPLYQLANDAKGALDDRAKEHKRTVNGREVKKDALCFLRTPMGWEQFERIADWKDELLKMLKPDDDATALPRGFLTRLSEIYQLYEGNVQRQRRRQRLGEITCDQMKEEIAYAKWVWRLVYQLSRFGERHKHFKDTIESLQRAITQDGLIDVLHVIARWTELLTRSDAE